jgi:hypothetical protein
VLVLRPGTRKTAVADLDDYSQLGHQHDKTGGCWQNFDPPLHDMLFYTFKSCKDAIALACVQTDQLLLVVVRS